MKTFEYYIYARKSSESEDRQILSIESQMNELKSIASRDGLSLKAIKTEAFSAKAPGRPIFNEVMNAVEAGQIQGLIVWNVDRLSRNSIDTGRLIYLFDIGKLQAVVTPSQTFRNTPNDKFLLNLLCGQAKLDNDNKGLNVKRGLKTKAEHGIFPGLAPLGYRNDRYAERGNKTIHTDPKRFKILRDAFEYMLTGSYTITELLRILNEEWNFKKPDGKPLARSTLYTLFGRPFYYGMFEYPVGTGNWYQGEHQPMITKDEYDRLQILLRRATRPRPKKHAFEFRGLITCGECGGAVTAEEKFKRPKNGKVHCYVYYHCTKRQHPECKQGCIEERALKTQIVSLLESIHIDSWLHNFAMTYFKKQHASVVTERKVSMKSYRLAYDRSLQQLDRLIDLRANDELTEQEFSTKKASITKEKARLEGLLKDAGAQPERWLEAADSLLTFARDASVKFETGSAELRREILLALGSNLTLKDQKLTVQLENPLLKLQTVATLAQAKNARLEPVKNGSIDTNFVDKITHSPVMLRALDEVRTSIGSSSFAANWARFVCGI